MHILYFHQYFITPRGIGGTRSYEFARRWIQKGHKVSIITLAAGLTDEEKSKASEIKGGILKFTVEGIDVYAFNMPYNQKMGYLGRSWCFLKFFIKASVFGIKLRSVDIVYATSTPLTVAIPALMKKRFSGIPFVFEVRDLWPAGIVAAGVVKNKLIILMLQVLEKLVYTQAAGIVALSPAMKAKIDATSHCPDKSIVVPNCSDTELFKPLNDDRRQQVRQKMGWSDRFVIIHTGTMGRVNGLDRVVGCAERLKEYTDILFVFLGDGSERTALEKTVRNKNLSNVQFVSTITKSLLFETLPAADVGLVSVSAFDHMMDNSANKFFDYLACGLPVLLNYGGWQKDVLDKHFAGLGCNRFEEDQFMDNVLRLRFDDQMRKEMGINARYLAEREYSRDLLAQQVLDFLTCRAKNNRK